MKIVSGSLFLTIMGFLLNSVKSSSQAGNLPDRNGYGNARALPSGRNHRTDIDPNGHPAASPPRARSISPDSRFASMMLPSPDGHGCGIEQLRFIRLLPKSDPNQIFKLRTYTFPANKSLEILVERGAFDPMPARQYIVLSTLNGDVFAILESTDVLVGIYRRFDGRMKRVRINMPGEDDNIIPLISEEIIRIPVGPYRPISRNFNVSFRH